MVQYTTYLSIYKMSKLSVCRCVIETIINTSITKLDDRIQITQGVGEGRISYSTHEEYR